MLIFLLTPREDLARWRTFQTSKGAGRSESEKEKKTEMYITKES